MRTQVLKIKFKIFYLVLIIFSYSVRANSNDEVLAALESWVDAFNNKDAKGIVALYADDAVFFGTTSAVLRDSPELVWEYFKTLTDLGDSTVTVGDHRIQVFDDMAVNTGYYSRHYSENGVKKSDHARFTFVYQKRNAEWRIVEHHSSVLP